MKTASAFTRAVETNTRAKNLKVQYPGNVAVNTSPIQSVLPCLPDFRKITYLESCRPVKVGGGCS